MMSSLFSNDLMMTMNWTGACGKTAFNKLKCCEVILRELLAI
jgi:hypothetical protein